MSSEYYNYNIYVESYYSLDKKFTYAKGAYYFTVRASCLSLKRETT